MFDCKCFDPTLIFGMTPDTEMYSVDWGFNHTASFKN